LARAPQLFAECSRQAHIFNGQRANRVLSEGQQCAKLRQFAARMYRNVWNYRCASRKIGHPADQRRSRNLRSVGNRISEFARLHCRPFRLPRQNRSQQHISCRRQPQQALRGLAGFWQIQNATIEKPRFAGEHADTTTHNPLLICSTILRDERGAISQRLDDLAGRRIFTIAPLRKNFCQCGIVHVYSRRCFRAGGQHRVNVFKYGVAVLQSAEASGQALAATGCVFAAVRPIRCNIKIGQRSFFTFRYGAAAATFSTSMPVILACASASANVVAAASSAKYQMIGLPAAAAT